MATKKTSRMKLPTLQYEKDLWEQGYLVIGIDEVGRGCLAGPVGVGAVCLKPAQKEKCALLESLGVNDSKKLSAKKRKEIKECLKEHILASSVTFSSVETINEKGIVAAVKEAIRTAVRNIQLHIHNKLQGPRPYFLLLDAFNIEGIPELGKERQKAIIKGDSLSISIASAAIMAKLERDALISKIGEGYPAYKWHENKGYATAEHLEAIRQNGVTEWHRRLYVRNVLKEMEYRE
jgi:ribonuclease HII